MKYVYLFFLLLIVENAFGQMISGKIKNDLNQPLVGATVTLSEPFKKSDDKKVVLSGENGDYKIENIKAGKYNLTISYTSFLTKDTIIVCNGNAEVNITLLSKSIQLDSVTIKSKKNFMEKKIDRIVYNVEGISLYENKSVTDILKSMPRLNVTRSNIEIKGSGTAAVMIDERVIYLTNKDLIDYLSILKDDISSVEVITNPPAKYDAQGSGLINIVTKKKKAYGLFGYVETSFTKNSYFINDETFNLGYRNRNFSLLSSLGGSIGAYRENTRASSTFFAPDQTSWSDEAQNKNNLNNQRFNVVAEWLLSKRTKIYSSYSLALSHNKTDKNHDLQYTNGGVVDSTGVTNGLNKDHGYTHIANVGISSSFGKKNNSLTGTVDYVNKLNNSVSNSTTFDYLDDLTTPTGTRYDQYNFGNIPKNVLSSKLDFSFPQLFEKFDMETGIKYTIFNNNSQTDYNELINNRSIYQGIITRDTFAYREQNMAAYVSLNRDLKKWSFKGGLRFERTLTRGSSTQEQNSNIFNNLFPSLFLQYKFTEGTSTDLSYTRRIIRPTLFDVNPFRVYTSIFSDYVGNPYLIPSLQDNYNFNFVLKSNYIFSAYYNITHLPIISLPFNTIDNTIESRKTNNGKLNNYGLNLDASFNFRSWLRSNFSFGIGSYKYHTDYSYNLGKTPVNVTLSTSQSLQISPTFSTDLNFSATLPGAYNISTQKGYSSLDIGLTKTLIKNKLILNIAAQDILRSNSQSATTVTNSFRTTNYNYYDFQQISLSVRYKFGKELKVVKKKANIQEIRRI